MTERIWQLQGQAKVLAEEIVSQRKYDDYMEYQQSLMDQTLNKFAELIIAECMEQVRGEYLPVLEDKEMMKDTHWDGYVQCGIDSVVAIREHFYGVEE